MKTTSYWYLHYRMRKLCISRRTAIKYSSKLHHLMRVCRCTVFLTLDWQCSYKCMSVHQWNSCYLVGCINCSLGSTSYVCERCSQLPRCPTCSRRLPAEYFTSRGLCQACDRKQNNPRVRSSARNVVTEVDIPTVETDTTFDAFLLRTEHQIQETVDDYRRRFGYIFLIINIIAMMAV